MAFFGEPKSKQTEIHDSVLYIFFTLDPPLVLSIVPSACVLCGSKLFLLETPWCVAAGAFVPGTFAEPLRTTNVLHYLENAVVFLGEPISKLKRKN